MPARYSNKANHLRRRALHGAECDWVKGEGALTGSRASALQNRERTQVFISLQVADRGSEIRSVSFYTLSFSNRFWIGWSFFQGTYLHDPRVLS